MQCHAHIAHAWPCVFPQRRTFAIFSEWTVKLLNNFANPEQAHKNARERVRRDDINLFMQFGLYSL